MDWSSWLRFLRRKKGPEESAPFELRKVMTTSVIPMKRDFKVVPQAIRVSVASSDQAPEREATAKLRRMIEREYAATVHGGWSRIINIKENEEVRTVDARKFSATGVDALSVSPKEKLFAFGGIKQRRSLTDNLRPGLYFVRIRDEGGGSYEAEHSVIDLIEQDDVGIKMIESLLTPIQLLAITLRVRLIDSEHIITIGNDRIYAFEVNPWNENGRKRASLKSSFSFSSLMVRGSVLNYPAVAKKGKHIYAFVPAKFLFLSSGLRTNAKIIIVRYDSSLESPEHVETIQLDYIFDRTALPGPVSVDMCGNLLAVANTKLVALFNVAKPEKPELAKYWKLIGSVPEELRSPRMEPVKDIIENVDIAFSSDCRYLAVASAITRRLKVYDTETKRAVYEEAFAPYDSLSYIARTERAVDVPLPASVDWKGDKIALLLTNGKLIVYEVVRGTQAHSLERELTESRSAVSEAEAHQIED